MKYENMTDKIMDNEAAKLFKILSAYFMTMATNIPPYACNHERHIYLALTFKRLTIKYKSYL